MGYSQKEAKIYLTLLRLGEAQVVTVGQATGLPRTTVQVIMERLHQDGLMNFYIMRGHKYWVAENPKCFLENLHKKEQTIEAVLPALSEMRKLARQKMHRTKHHEVVDQLYMFVSRSVQPILIADKEGVILSVNSAWEKLFGYTQKEVKGKPTNMLASGKTPEAVYVSLWRTLKRRRMFQTDQVVDMRKDGTCFTACTTIFSLEINEDIYYIQVLEERD